MWDGILVRLDYCPAESGVWKLLFPACICAQRSNTVSPITPASLIYGWRNREKFHIIIWGKQKCFKDILRTKCSCWFQVLQDLISRTFLAGGISHVGGEGQKKTRRTTASWDLILSSRNVGCPSHFPKSPPFCPLKTSQCWHAKCKYCQAWA